MKRYYTNALDSHVFEHPDGPFVLWAEHAAELDAKNVKIGRLNDDVMRLTKAVEFRDARYADLAADYEALKFQWLDREQFLMDRIRELEALLRELLDSTLAQIPPFEAGKAAQDAWADRRAKARNDADAALRAGEAAQSANTARRSLSQQMRDKGFGRSSPFNTGEMPGTNDPISDAASAHPEASQTEGGKS